MTLTSTRAEFAVAPRFRLELGDYVTAAEFAPEAGLCVVGTGDGTIVGLELATGRERYRHAAHGGGVLGLSVAPDGRGFLTCGQMLSDSSRSAPAQPQAKLWSIEGELVKTLASGDGWVEHVAWAPSGSLLATAAGRRVRFWTASGEPVVETESLASTVTGIAWRADGKALAATCYGGVHVWTVEAGATSRHLAWKGSLISVAWSPDAKVVACGSQDGSVHFWRLETGEDSEMRGYPFKPKVLAWDRDSHLLATSGDAKVTVWDFRGKGPEGTRPIQLQGHAMPITCLTFGRSESMLASGAKDGSVCLWTPRVAKRPRGRCALAEAITTLSWHPEEPSLLVGDAAGNLSLWEVC